VVDLVLVPAAARDLDQDIELHGAQPRGAPQGSGQQRTVFMSAPFAV